MQTEDAPIVKFVQHILLDAIKQGASDIHFEPYEHQYRIRYRLDGLLIEVPSVPVNLSTRITSRLKILSNLDISERRRPQDGRFNMTLSENQSIEFRISTCPTNMGEKVVLRILNPVNTQVGIESLGLTIQQQALFMDALSKPQGMILVTGPTGSGKTVTLYSALNLVNTPSVNISTVEDPIEINIHGINQVNIHPKAGLTFATVLRAFLRQDPDIIMIGEIRDLETADIAMKAAETGHLVLSTLHTNSASDTITRLMNMGLPPFAIAHSLRLLIAQRLIRKLCDACKLPDYPTNSLVLAMGFTPEQAAQLKAYKAASCTLCTNGYKGRLGLFELIPITSSLSDIILSGGSSRAILQQSISEGMVSIRQMGLMRVQQGLTSIHEINRMTCA